MATEGPQRIRTDLMTARQLLDDALVGLRAISDVEMPLMETRSYVSASLASVYEALAHATEHGPYRGHTKAALQHARDALTSLSFRPSPDDGVMESMRLVAQAIGQLSADVRPPEASLRLPRGEERAELRASVDVPMLHDPQRLVLFPTIPLPELDGVPRVEVDLDAAPVDPPPPVNEAADLEGLHAWGQGKGAPPADEEESATSSAPPPPSPTASADPDGDAVVAVFGKAPPAASVVWQRGRAFFEDIAMMSLMRQAGPGERWSNLDQVERRMLARVDAILACGSWILPRLVQLLEERPIPDSEMLFGALFLLGCVHGDDTRDQIERLLRVTPLDDDELFDSCADALSFAPHRGIEGIMRRWLDEPSPRKRLAVRVLGRRRATTTSTLIPLHAEDDAELHADVSRALERVPGELDPSALSVAVGHASPRAFRAAAECALVRGYAVGMREARARLSRGGALGGPALLTAISASGDALELLLGAAATAPDRDVYAALGWFGSIEAVPFLLGRLAAGDEAAVLGLQRITGASLSDEDEGPKEYEEDVLPFSRARWVAPEPVILSVDAERWSAWWERYGRAADPKVRYRWGHRWTTRDDLFEISDAIATPEERRLAHLELCARTGGGLPLDIEEFVVRQRAQIDAWAEYLGDAHHRAHAGTWPVRLTK
ncbi:MAG: hypothetical protein AB7S26_04435 [Sandaracinaceae bacterium]